MPTPIPSRAASEAAGRWLLRLLLAAVAGVVFVPLVLTFYLSVFGETLIAFPPHAYTARWYARIPPEFGAALRTIDPWVEEAAGSLSAAPGRSFWRVWPLALPGTATAGILYFVLAMNAYAAPCLLGGPRFQMAAPLHWEFSTNTNLPFALAMALLLMTVTLVLTSCSGLPMPARYRA